MRRKGKRVDKKLLMDDPFRVVAVIAAFNEGDIISAVISHLVENGVDVYLMDNHSTDDTVDQARGWLGRGLLKIESFPQNSPFEMPGTFDWTAILRRKEELANELCANWFIHHDADEIRESPWPGLTLKEAIRWVDSLGYDCIDFRLFNFPPSDDGFKQGDDPRIHFTYYENPAEFDTLQVKCWKAGKGPVSLVPWAGHDARFENRRVFPIQFLLRHYPIRSQSHGLKKVFSERKSRFAESERSKGWHIQYDQIRDQTFSFLRKPNELHLFDLDRARLELMLPDKILRNLAERFIRADAELDRLRAEKQGLERERDELRKDTAPLQQMREELKQYAANLESEREEMRNRMARLETLEYRAQALEQEVRDLRHSWSWRLTAPMRRLFDLVKAPRR